MLILDLWNKNGKIMVRFIGDENSWYMYVMEWKLQFNHLIQMSDGFCGGAL